MNLGKTVLYEVWAVPTVSHIGDTQLYPRRLQVVDEHETDERLSVVAGIGVRMNCSLTQPSA